MMFGLEGMTEVLIMAACLGAQYFLASRRHIFWGAVLPTAFIIWRGTLFFTTDNNILAQVVILTVGLAFLLEQWRQGRYSLNNKQQKQYVTM